MLFRSMVVVLTACSHKITKDVQVQKSDDFEEITNNFKVDGKTISQLKITWQNEFIFADGIAPVLTKYPEETRNLMLAKRAAVIDAQRNLAEKINEVRLSASTTMSDFQAVDFVQSRITARLKETQVINEYHNVEKGLYEIKIQMPKWEIAQILEEYVER